MDTQTHNSVTLHSLSVVAATRYKNAPANFKCAHASCSMISNKSHNSSPLLNRSYCTGTGAGADRGPVQNFDVSQCFVQNKVTNIC